MLNILNNMLIILYFDFLPTVLQGPQEEIHVCKSNEDIHRDSLKKDCLSCLIYYIKNL